MAGEVRSGLKKYFEQNPDPSVLLGIIHSGMSSQLVSSRSWDGRDTEGFRRLMAEQCLAGEMAYRLGRTVEEIEAKATELGLQMPREYDTSFFVKHFRMRQEKAPTSGARMDG